MFQYQSVPYNIYYNIYVTLIIFDYKLKKKTFSGLKTNYFTINDGLCKTIRIRIQALAFLNYDS